MTTLREVLKEAKSKNIAIGHFNISDSEGFKAIVNGAREIDVPVIVGVSEGEEKFLGISEAVALVESARNQGEKVYLNADHSYSVERAKKAIDAGFDAVIFDGAKLSFEENVRQTKEVVDYAKKSGRDVLVEGELGYIGTSSKIIEETPKDFESQMTTPGRAREFVEKTGVDLFAPAVGNIHGIVRGIGNPKLRIDLIENISRAVPVPLVLHGGSGISDEDFRQAIKAGISVIHINTELRLAYHDALKKDLADTPEETTPYKFMAGGERAMEEVVKKRLQLFTYP